jgi:glyoxylase-like metal-dependent hydrolase (beta-lactamase superfamily II)
VSLDVRAFTVGPIQENAYVLTADRAGGRAVVVDPGEEPERLLAATQALGVEVEAILVTHCHFDHIGAVAPLARATGAPVYCPRVERLVLANIMAWTPPGFGPFESWEPEHTVAGGERLQVAGLDVEVVSTPGHSPGHVTYAITAATASAPTPAASSAATSAPPPALLSGDVLFQGSVGRVDLPGGDWPTLERSIGTLLASYPGETVVYPGHGATTTLGRELQTNPFLAELRAAATGQPAPAPQPAGTPAAATPAR